MVKKRESGIELLRIILLIQIVFLHVSDYGSYEDCAMSMGSMTKVIYLAQWLLCRCPVPLLFMLTGYFTADKELEIKSTLKKCFHSHNTMWFYALAITGVFYLYRLIKPYYTIDFMQIPYVGRIQAFQALFPMLSDTWFFMSDYLLVMFLSPFVNMSLRRLNKKQYLLLVVVLTFVFTVWTSLVRLEGLKEIFKITKVIDNESGKSLYMALYLYILGGYVHKFTQQKKGVRILPLVGFFALWAINLTLTLKCEAYSVLFKRSDNLIVIAQCVLLVLFFRSLHFSSNIINRIAKCNIAVYLIHEQPLMRIALWSAFPFLNDIEFYRQSPAKYLAVVWGVCIGVYAVCNCFEQIRLVVLDGIKKLVAKIKNPAVEQAN